MPFTKNISTKGCEVKYIEVRHDIFVDLINLKGEDFLDYNKHSLYIIRGGNYIDIKIFLTLLTTTKLI